MSEHQKIMLRCNTRKFLCLSEAEFHERLVQFFRPFLSIKRMDWACIQNSLTYFAPFLKFKDLLDLYFDYIFGLFEDYRITDRAVILTCVKKYCRFQMHYCGFRFAGADEFSFPVDMRQDYVVSHYEYTRVPVYLQDLPSRSFLYRDLSAVKRILRYVAPVTVECEDLCNYASYVKYRICWQDPFMDYVDCYQWDERQEAFGVRRLKLILMALDFLLQVRIENKHDSINGLRLLFLAIPDPTVTWLEIFGFLKSRIMLWPTDKNHLYIRSFLDTCMACFPECLQVLKPRSLKHLARCEVRKCLGQNNYLPNGVWGLGLPREVEDYVLLQTRKDQFRPVIRPLSSERVFVLEPVP